MEIANKFAQKKPNTTDSRILHIFGIKKKEFSYKNVDYVTKNRKHKAFNVTMSTVSENLCAGKYAKLDCVLFESVINKICSTRGLK